MKEEIIEFYINEIEQELNVDLFKYRSKTNEMVFARAVAYYIFMEGFGMSCTEIGKVFGKSHATVMHSINKIIPHLKTVPKYYRVIDRLFMYTPMHKRLNKQAILDPDLKVRHDMSNLLIINNKLTLDNRLLHEEIGKIHAELEAYRNGQRLLGILKDVPEEKIPLVEERLSAMVKML